MPHCNNGLQRWLGRQVVLLDQGTNVVFDQAQLSSEAHELNPLIVYRGFLHRMDGLDRHA